MSKLLLKQVKVATDNTKNTDNLTLESFMEVICCKHQLMSYLVLYPILWLQTLEHYDSVMQTSGEQFLFLRKKRMKELKKKAFLSEF